MLLETSGRFFDRDCFKKEADKLLVPVRAFVGDPRTLLFEYVPESKEIVMDGIWGQELDYTKHTPMTTWKISIADYEGTEKAADQQHVDFSSLKGITWEFTCDVVWTGY